MGTGSFVRALAFVLAGAAVGFVCEGTGLVLPQDRGPDTVDVSGYPKDIQADYQVTARVCGQCHSLARVFNTIAPPRFWARYLGNMQANGRVQVSDQTAVQIYDFLVYDEVYRKEKTPKSFYPPLTEDQLREAGSGPGR